jgi:hypothetical protein
LAAALSNGLAKSAIALHIDKESHINSGKRRHSLLVTF